MQFMQIHNFYKNIFSKATTNTAHYTCSPIRFLIF